MKSTNECIDYIYSMSSNIPHSNITSASHLFGTYSILKRMDAPEHVCLAGLFHSIYSTEIFKCELAIERETVKYYIGEMAEELVFLFCHFRNRDYTILKSENRDLMFVNLANMIEHYSEFKSDDLKELIDLYQCKLQSSDV